MPDPLALMLDSMIFAVENGLSYDGIVSVPQIGLEDWGHRPGMAGWLDEGAEIFRTTTEAFSKLFRGTPQMRMEPPPYKDDTSVAGDSGIGPGDKRSVRDPTTPLESPALESSHTGDESARGGDEPYPSPVARLPRKSGRQVEEDIESEVTEETRPRTPLPRKRESPVSEKLPRKQVPAGAQPTTQGVLPRKRDEQASIDDQESSSEESAQDLEDIAPSHVGPSPPTSSLPRKLVRGEPRPVTQGILPRKRDKQASTDDEGSPSQESAQDLEDITPSSAYPSLSTGSGDEDVIRPSDGERQKYPRLKDKGEGRDS